MVIIVEGTDVYRLQLPTAVSSFCLYVTLYESGK